ncbi:hypothetical protein [Thalassospira alkalitolerans]|uniref:hypothetical protein n=1 Tax=Thalassospira alkalitolerans TaxID=1293890 RepID=UPI003AA9920A
MAGLVAVCAGSDVMHPIGAADHRRAGRFLLWGVEKCQAKMEIDDVLAFALAWHVRFWAAFLRAFSLRPWRRGGIASVRSLRSLAAQYAAWDLWLWRLKTNGIACRSRNYGADLRSIKSPPSRG